MKVLVGAFNLEKALLEAFSMIVKTDCETDGSFYSTTILCAPRLATRHPASTAATIPHTHAGKFLLIHTQRLEIVWDGKIEGWFSIQNT